MSHALCVPVEVLDVALPCAVANAASGRPINHYHLGLFARVDTESHFHCSYG